MCIKLSLLFAAMLVVLHPQQMVIAGSPEDFAAFRNSQTGRHGKQMFYECYFRYVRSSERKDVPTASLGITFGEFQNKGNLRLLRQRIVSQDKTNSSEIKDWLSSKEVVLKLGNELLLSNERYNAFIVRADSNGPYVLNDLNSDDLLVQERQYDWIIDRLMPPVEEWVKRGAKIKSFKTVEQGNKSFRELRILRENMPITMEISILYRAEDGLCESQHWEITAGQEKASYDVRIDYVTSDRGVLLPQNLRIEQERDKSVETYSLSGFETGSSPGAEIYYLKHYGIPEPTLPSNSTVPLSLIIFAIGFAVATIGAIFMNWNRLAGRASEPKL